MWIQSISKAATTRRLIPVFTLVAALVLLSSSLHAVPLLVLGHSSDPWETDWRDDHTQTCSDLDTAFYAAVPPAKRAAAIAKLDREAIIPLADEDARNFMQIGAGHSGYAATMLDAAIDKLETQKRLELDHQIGSWGRLYQDNLDQLKNIRFGPRLRQLTPILVRSLGDNDLPWHTLIDTCDNEGAVRVRGDTRSLKLAPRRVPLILLLERVPKKVLVLWGAIDPNSAP